MSTMTKKNDGAVEIELVPSEVSDVDATDIMGSARRILDRTTPCDDVVEALRRLWRFDFGKRRYAASVSRPMRMRRDEHDLAIYLASLADEDCVVRLPYYKRRKLPSKRKRTNDVLEAAATRGGRITRLISARDVFSFSVQLGGWNFVLVDPKDGWYSGWKSIQLLEAGSDGSPERPHKENASSFQGFVHPNRWMLFYSPIYLNSKLALLRLKEEVSYLKKEHVRLSDEFFERYWKLPPKDRGLAGVEGPPSGEVDESAEVVGDEADAPGGGSDADFYRGKFKVVETGVFEAVVFPDGFNGVDLGGPSFPAVVVGDVDVVEFRKEDEANSKGRYAGLAASMFDVRIDAVEVGPDERKTLESLWFGAEKARRRAKRLNGLLVDLQFQCRAVEYAVEDKFKVLSGGDPEVLRRVIGVQLGSSGWQEGFKIKPRGKIVWRRLPVGGGLNLAFRTRVKKEKVWL